MIARHRWQRGIVLFVKMHVSGEAVTGQLMHSVEYLMDVDRLAAQGNAVREHLHAIDEGAYAVGLVADQAGQGAIAGDAVLFQELRRAANPGKRILHFVGQHRCHGGDRTGGASVGELAIDLVGDGALAQDDNDTSRRFGQRRSLHVEQVAANARRLQGEAVFGNRAALGAHLLYDRKQRTIGGQESVQGQAS